MNSSEARLENFLETMAATPFADGASDCALTVADWVMTARSCPDPALGLRGQYRSAAERDALLKSIGGLKAAMTAAAARAGLKTTRQPRRGDVGLVTLSGRMLAGICLGRSWAAKGDGLVVEIPRRVLKAWRV